MQTNQLYTLREFMNINAVFANANHKVIFQKFTLHSWVDGFCNIWFGIWNLLNAIEQKMLETSYVEIENIKFRF